MSGFSSIVGQIKSPISQKGIDELDTLFGLAILERRLGEMKIIPGFKLGISVDKIPVKKRGKAKV